MGIAEWLIKRKKSVHLTEVNLDIWIDRFAVTNVVMDPENGDYVDHVVLKGLGGVTVNLYAPHGKKVFDNISESLHKADITQ